MGQPAQRRDPLADALEPATGQDRRTAACEVRNVSSLLLMKCSDRTVQLENQWVNIIGV